MYFTRSTDSLCLAFTRGAQDNRGISLYPKEEISKRIYQISTSELERSTLHDSTNALGIHGKLCMKFVFVILAKRLSANIESWPTQISEEELNFFYQRILEDNVKRGTAFKRLEIEDDVSSETLLLLFSMGFHHLKESFAKWDPRYIPKILAQEADLSAGVLIRDALEFFPDIEAGDIVDVAQLVETVSDLLNKPCPLPTIIAQISFLRLFIAKDSPTVQVAPEDKIFIVALCYFKFLRFSFAHREQNPISLAQDLVKWCPSGLSLLSLDTLCRRDPATIGERDFKYFPSLFPLFLTQVWKTVHKFDQKGFVFILKQIRNCVKKISQDSLQNAPFRQGQWGDCGDLIYAFNSPMHELEIYKQGSQFLETLFKDSIALSHEEAHLKLVNALLAQEEGDEYRKVLGWVIYKTWWYEGDTLIKRLMAWHAVNLLIKERGQFSNETEFDLHLKARVRALYPMLPLCTDRTLFYTLQAQAKKGNPY